MPRKKGGKFSFQQMQVNDQEKGEDVQEPPQKQADLHEKADEKVECSACSKTFSAEQYLQAHIRYAHKCCNICDEIVLNLEEHVAQAHYSKEFSLDVWTALRFYTSLPSELLPYEKRKLIKLFKEEISINLDKVDLEKVLSINPSLVTDRLYEVSRKCKTSFMKILVPPTKLCFHCGANLKLANPPIHVVLFDECGPVPALKYSYRCQSCPVMKGEVTYNVEKFSRTNDGLSFYDNPVDVIKSTTRAYISRNQMSSFVRTFFHCWASYAGNSEAYNDAKATQASRCLLFLQSIGDEEPDKIPEDPTEDTTEDPTEEDLGPLRRHILDRRLLSRAFRIYMTEEELRERDIISTWSFIDDEQLKSYDKFMQFVDGTKGAYQHECTEGCKAQGCKLLYVLDGIWKLNYPHCMFYSPCKDVNTDVALPPVCTKAPKHSMAFCEDHCPVVEKLGYSTSLRTFLKEAGADDEKYNISGKKKVDALLLSLFKKSDLQTDEDSLKSQGVHDDIRKALRSRSAPKNLSADTKPHCNHETVGKQRLQKYSRGHLVIVEGGGHVAYWAPLYQSEGPAQVAMILLTFLLTCIAPLGKAVYKNIWIAYDNICHLAALNIFKKPLNFMGRAKNIWHDLNKIIDGLHIKNHTEKRCQEEFHPDRLKSMYPNFNTMVAEQTFSWLGRFKRVLNNMGKTHHHFLLHRLFVMRNEYNTRMYKLGRKPLYPAVPKNNC